VPSATAALATAATSLANPWESLAPGLERRTLIPDNNAIAQLVTLRIDPTLYTFRAHYRPGQPLTARQWADALPGVVAFVNANFFSRENRVIGLLVADGVRYGESLRGLGGIFQVYNGQVRVRSNILEPYQGEAFEQAVQAYPMLVADGQPAFTNPRPDRFSRRTVIGQDSAGRIMLMATPLLGLTLLDLSAYLPTTDLALVNAFNLDGGRSTLLYFNAPGVPEYLLSSIDPVPAVLAVYRR
jgi:exopolysaccharide biosynthesis protein